MRSLVLALVVVVTSVPALARQAPRLRVQPYRFEAADGTRVDAELGELEVPEHRARPGSRTIRLRFVRFAATSKRPGSPIVYLAGGPGGSGIAAARGSRFPLFMALRAHGDVIALDQRGTGLSEPSTRCTERYVIPPGEPLRAASGGAAMAEAVRRCADRLRGQGLDPGGYTTRESAADLEALRNALGAEKLTLWGISYGTHLALAALAAYGPRVDRLILAGVECLDCTDKLPSDQQRLLERIAGLAASDPDVRARVPDLLGSIRALLGELEARPKTVALARPGRPGPAPITVGALDLQVVLAGMLDGPESFAVLPDLVWRLERGDWTALALLAADFRAGTAPSLMAVAMDCASGASTARRRRIANERAGALLGDAINLPFPHICSGVGVADLGDAFRAPVRSPVPALVISGTLDGRTPARNGEELARGLRGARHLVVEGAGHSDPLFLSSPKILEAMEAFLRGERIAAARVTLPPMRFVRPREVRALPGEVLERYVGAYRTGGGSVRRVAKAGDLLFTVRDGGEPRPLRPVSEREFFHEGSGSTVRFELGPDGAPRAMTSHAAADLPGERAERLPETP